MPDSVKDKLGISPERIVAILPAIRALQTLMEGSLFTKRICGLAASTAKPNPTDCKYVMMCILEWAERAEDFQKFSEIIKRLAEELP